MKKTIISLAAASLVASSAMAADKGINFTTTGQAVLYYQTANTDVSDLFKQKQSVANFGVQLNNDADLGNGYLFGSQLSYLGTAGLEKKLVGGTKQNAGTLYNTTDEIALTKIYVAKKVANTTVKVGRQELPQSLSPLAYTESFNVFKNTYDAVVVVNTDLPKTTLVGAMVGKSTGQDLNKLENLQVNGSLDVNGAAYMLTAVNSSLPMTTLTGTVYALRSITTAKSAVALWADAQIADKSFPMGLQVGVQTGMILPKASGLNDTVAFGLKATAKPMPELKVCGAFSYVNDGTAHVINTGSAATSPLYTQMVVNGEAISTDNSSFMVAGNYALGKELGNVIGRFGYTVDNSNNNNDTTEFDLMYKTKLAGATVFAAYVYTKDDKKIGKSKDGTNIIRAWARYAF